LDWLRNTLGQRPDAQNYSETIPIAVRELFGKFSERPRLMSPLAATMMR
jgi:hypothetical protein